MIVVHLLVGLGGVIDDLIDEGDATLLAMVGEAEVVQYRRARGEGRFLDPAIEQPARGIGGGTLARVGPTSGREGERGNYGEDLVQMAMTPQAEFEPPNSPGISDDPR